MGILNYARHFALLAFLAGILVMTPRLAPALGMVANFGVYGALHAAAVALTLRRRQPAAHKGRFVAIGAVLSMSSVAIGMGVSRAIGGPTGMAQAALLLCLCSGLGAASYAGLIRLFFGAPLPLSGIAAIVLGCMTATLSVLISAGHRQGGGLWLAVSWWFAMSLGLWACDGWTRNSRCTEVCLPEKAKDGTIGRIEETERR